jgi:MFS family permease
MPEPEEQLRVGVPAAGPGFRGALRNRDFRLLWAGQLGSEIGNGLVILALPWLVLDLTGSAFQLGVAYFFQFLPVLLFGIVGGVFVDRWDRRTTIVIANAIRGTGFLSIGIVYFFGGLTVHYLYFIIFLEATMANFFNPARAALVPNLVGPENLRSANSLVEVARHVGVLIAPPAGGVLVAVLGPAAIMFGNGIAFLIFGFAVFLIRWRPPVREVVPTAGLREATSRFLEQTGDGLSKIRRSRLLLVTVFLGFSLNLIVAPIQVLLPLFVRDIKGQEPPYFGALVGGLLLGLIIGSLSAPAIARAFGLGRVATMAVIILGGVIIVASWPPGLWAPVVAMVFAGTAIGTLNVAQMTMLQGATTDEERGRVSATYFTLTYGVRPFGFLFMGVMAGAADIRWLFVALGVVALIIGGVLVRSREVQETH